MPYAVLSTDQTTLSFYYDTNKSSRSGTVYTAANFREYSDGSWGPYSSHITKVVFDSSFANYTGLTSTANWFYGCSKMTTISGIENLNTQNVTRMSFMFSGCSSLTSLNLSSFNTQNVTYMNCMFFGCSSLTTLNLSSFDTQNVTNMCWMFQGCSSLKTIVVGGEWSTTKVIESAQMFYGCTSLVGGDGTKFNSSYTNKTKAYAGQGGYLTLKYAVLSTDQTTLSFYYDTNKSSRSGTVYTAANFRKLEGDSWGAYRSNITKVVFDSSFANYTGLTSTANWFNGCSELTTISGIENLKTQNVTNMNLMFYDCSSLTSLNLSSFNTQNVTAMESMFYGCSSLTSLDLSSFNTQKVRNMSYMFLGCSSLTSLNLSSFNTQNVTNMWYMFDGCSSLTSLNLSSFNTQNVTNMRSMFANCSSLTSLDLSSFNTQNVTNMRSMFYECSSLKTIVVGGEWSTTNVTSSTQMFYGCTSLVGGDGTKYNSSYMDKTKAYAGQGGYLTLKGAGTGTDTRTYNGRTWMIGNYAPIRYDFASINAAMASSQVKDGDILLVDRVEPFYQDVTITKSVKMVCNEDYLRLKDIDPGYSYIDPVYSRSVINAPNIVYPSGYHIYGNLNIEANNVTISGLRVYGSINVREEGAWIEHCNISNSILSGYNYECDDAYINCCHVGGSIDDENGFGWTMTNNYVHGELTNGTTGYVDLKYGVPYFSEINFPTETKDDVLYGVRYKIANTASVDCVEMFWDTDPGWGKAEQLTTSTGNYLIDCSSTPVVMFKTNSLSAGVHKLVVRARSTEGYWVTSVHTVNVAHGSEVVTDPTPVFSLVDFPTSGVNTDYKISFAVAAEGGLIDWVEYYWDNDPGQKNGHCIVDGGHDAGQGITRYNYSIDCGGLTGSHTLYLRAFCGSKSTVVYVKEIKLTAPSIDYINADDLAALKLISDNLGLGGYWNFANNGRYESDFPGVTFLNHRVIEINLANRGLTGTLSTSWMPSLPELTLLNLSRNNIYGDITPLVAKMPKLKTLNVSYNRITQVSGLLPATLTTFNAASQMRMASSDVTPSSENFINPLVSGSLTPTTAPVGQAVSLALPSLFYYDADKNDNSLRADIQVVDVNKPETVYGTYSYNGANSGWKFTPQQQTSISLEDKKFVALVTRGKWQQWSACPAQLSVLLGDANIDGTVDVLDVQHTLNYILATAQPFNYWAANTYTDQIINVQDIVCTVNIMLGLPNNARRSDRARSLDRRADDAADASCWVYEQNGRIALTSADDIAAIDIEVEGASTDEVSLLLRHKDFSMIGQNTATGSRYVIFSTTGATIPAGTGAAVLALSHSAVPVAIRCADTTAREVKAAIGTPTGISEVHSAADGKTVIETRLAPGVYIVRTIEADGTSKTVKVLKK